MKSDSYYADGIGDYEKLYPRVDQKKFYTLIEFHLTREDIRLFSIPATATSMAFTASAATAGPMG